MLLSVKQNHDVEENHQVGKQPIAQKVQNKAAQQIMIKVSSNCKKCKVQLIIIYYLQIDNHAASLLPRYTFN